MRGATTPKGSAITVAAWSDGPNGREDYLPIKEGSRLSMDATGGATGVEAARSIPSTLSAQAWSHGFKVGAKTSRLEPSVSDHTSPLHVWITQNESEIRSALRPIAYKIAPYRGVGIEETLADLLVEVVRRLLEHSEVFNADQPPYGWILRAAHYVTLRWRDEALLALKRGQETPEGLELGDNGLASAQMLDAITIRQLLSGLSGVDRQVVELFILQERSAEEVGRMIGLSAGNVRVRWHRLQGKMKAQIAGEMA